MVLPLQARRVLSQHLHRHIQRTCLHHRSLPAAVEACGSPTLRQIHLSSRTTSLRSPKKRTRFRERRTKCGSLMSFPSPPHVHPFWKTLQQYPFRKRPQTRIGFRKFSGEGLAMSHPKLQAGFPRNWTRPDSKMGNHPCCRHHRCPDWVPYHRVRPCG